MRHNKTETGRTARPRTRSRAKQPASVRNEDAQRAKRLADLNARAEAKRLDEARKLFSRLPTDLKGALVVEVCQTRGEELKRAYRDLRGIAVGSRLQRPRQGARSVLLDEPCVVFLVKAKQPEDELKPARRLPKELLCHVDVEGARRLCAVPTDVLDASKRTRFRSQAKPGQIKTMRGDLSGEPEFGAIACALALPDKPNDTFVVSCRHVFSPPGFSPTDPHRVQLKADETEFADTDPQLRGILVTAPAPGSCDVQLARVTDAAACRRGLGDISFDGFVKDESDLAALQDLFILVPDADPIPVKKHLLILSSDSFPDPVHYGPPFGDVLHEALIQSVFSSNRETERGHSGSPLGTMPTGGLLVGMHIAKDENHPNNPTPQPRACAIPAWLLLDPKQYQPRRDGEQWRLVKPQDIKAPAPPQTSIATAPAPAAGFLAGVTAAGLSPPRQISKSAEFDFASLKNELEQYLNVCQILKMNAVDQICDKIVQNKNRYEPIENVSNVPWYFIGIIHSLEAGLKFNRHLHNGDPLSGRTKNKPAGRPAKPPQNGVSYTFEESAIDALRFKSLDKIPSWNSARILFEAERYNGLGYRFRGIPSAYLWGLSNLFVRGKFIADGVFDPNEDQKQAGVATLLKRLQQRADVPV